MFLLFSCFCVDLSRLLKVWWLAGQNEKELGSYSLSGRTSYRTISWGLQAARSGFSLFQSLWNMTGASAEALTRCLTNFRAIRWLQHPISRLRVFTRSYGKTSVRLVNRDPGVCRWMSVRDTPKWIFPFHNLSKTILVYWLHHLMTTLFCYRKLLTFEKNILAIVDLSNI